MKQNKQLKKTKQLRSILAFALGHWNVIHITKTSEEIDKLLDTYQKTFPDEFKRCNK